MLLVATGWVVLLAQQVPVNPWAPYIGGGSITAIMSFLWWEERKERKESQERERTTYKECTDIVAREIETLKKTGELLMARRRSS